jgi:hypothetical protein
MFNASRDVPIIKNIKGRVAVLSLLTFFAISMLGFSLPVFAHDIPTPYCSTTGSYQVCTDQEDYSPTSIVHIAGSGFVSDPVI